jgi:hypothetical protein
MDALGGEEAFEKIEVFQPTVYFDRMNPSLLPSGHSVARGLYCPDSTGIQRHAISCKVRLKQEYAANLPQYVKLTKDALEPFVMTFSEQSKSFKKEDPEVIIKYEKWMWERGSKKSSFIRINYEAEDVSSENYQPADRLDRLTQAASFEESCNFLRGLIEGSDPNFELVPNEANSS